MALNDGLADLQIYSVEFSGAQSSHTTGSFTNLRVTNYNISNSLAITGSFVDANGKLQSNSVGSPSTYGAFIQGATGSTNAGNSGLILWGKVFSNSSYQATITPITAYNPASAAHAGSPYYISGLQNVSGISIIGPTGTTFYAIAIGT